MHGGDWTGCHREDCAQDGREELQGAWRAESQQRVYSKVWIIERASTASTGKAKEKKSIPNTVSLILMVTSCGTAYLEWWGQRRKRE